MARRRRSNEFSKRAPNAAEVREARKLARRVSKKLAEMMEAKDGDSIKDDE
jgi:hypothetical protein